MEPASSLVSAADPEEAAADHAAAARNFVEARRLLERIVERQPENIEAWLKLAAMRRASGDAEAALVAVAGALRVDPLHFTALISRARLLEAKGDRQEADRAYIRALAQGPQGDDTVPPELQALLDHARARSDQYRSRIAATWQHAIDEDPALDDAERASLARFKTNGLRQTRVFHSEPSHYHYPGLVEREFHRTASFPWVAQLEAATDDILAECEALIALSTSAAVPYIQYGDDAPVRQWKALNHSMDWTAFHLLRGGQRIVENARHCPATMAVLQAIPQPRIAGRSPNAMFSLLRPHTRIPPHTGVANTRLVCHLPLVVPPNCWFRVGAERREWRVGEAMIFDDTIEHEAANDSDLPRVVLIIDVWHPELSATERAAVARIMEAEQVEHGAPI